MTAIMLDRLRWRHRNQVGREAAFAEFRKALRPHVAQIEQQVASQSALARRERESVTIPPLDPSTAAESAYIGVTSMVEGPTAAAATRLWNAMLALQEFRWRGGKEAEVDRDPHWIAARQEYVDAYATFNKSAAINLRKGLDKG